MHTHNTIARAIHKQARLDLECERDERHRLLRDARIQQDQMQAQAKHDKDAAVAAAVRDQKNKFNPKVEELEKSLLAMRCVASQRSGEFTSLEERLQEEQAKARRAEALSTDLEHEIEEIQIEHSKTLARERQICGDEVNAAEDRAVLLEKRWVEEREALERKSSTEMEKMEKALRETRSDLNGALVEQKSKQSEWDSKTILL